MRRDRLQHGECRHERASSCALTRWRRSEVTREDDFVLECVSAHADERTPVTPARYEKTGRGRDVSGVVSRGRAQWVAPLVWQRGSRIVFTVGGRRTRALESELNPTWRSAPDAHHYEQDDGHSIAVAEVFRST